MAVVINEHGERKYANPEFVSRNIYEAYKSGKSWDTENYILIEYESILTAWVTTSEKAELSKLAGFDSISRFFTSLGILAIPRDDFNNWMQGGQKK